VEKLETVPANVKVGGARTFLYNAPKSHFKENVHVGGVVPLTNMTTGETGAPGARGNAPVT